MDQYFMLKCFTRIWRFRKAAFLVLAWILLVNSLLAFLWLRPIGKDNKGFLGRALYSSEERIGSANGSDAKVSKQGEKFNVVLKQHVVNDSNFEALSESYFDIIDSKTNGVRDTEAEFVFVIPNSFSTPLKTFDRNSMLRSGRRLQGTEKLDAVACLPQNTKKILNNSNIDSDQDWKGFFNLTWCNFARKEWSIQVRNNGIIDKASFYIRSQRGRSIEKKADMMQMCNIINGPFVIRKKAFSRLNGLRTRFGRVTLLDFFLRSNGRLKIGKFSDCFYSNELFRFDRGPLEGTHDFPEYSYLGVEHNLLRIITENRIEWTKCIANNRFCKEKPYVPPSTLPQVGQPICCSVVLGQMLKDIVEVFTKLDIKYRLLYGTLLGALRNEAIIPYVYDLDFAVDDNYGLNWANYDTLQPHFGDRYSISSNSFMGMPRLLPLMPAHLDINTSRFFDGDLDVEGKMFFSEEIQQSINGLLPFTSSNWRTRGYSDFYRGWDVWWNGSSLVKVNGRNYTAMTEKYYEVELWYGKNWRTPILSVFESQSDQGAA